MTKAYKTKKPKKFNPLTIIAVLVPILIITLCLIFGNTNQGSQVYSGETINWSSYSEKTLELSDSLSITEPGTYYLTGTIADGSISINTPGAVRLVLDNVSVKNSSGPAIMIYTAKSTTIELAENSESYLEDGKNYSGYEEKVTSTLYSTDDLIIEGSGKLTIVGNYADGIKGKDNILIKGGELEISVVDDGIHVRDDLVIDGGTVSVKKSKEGLEATNVYINGGDISVTSSDDGINAVNSDETSFVLEINGGNLTVNAGGDGLDSNGTITFNGGTVTVNGPSDNGNSAVDSETGIFYNGGNLIALGSSGMVDTPRDSGSGNVISVFLASQKPANTKVALKTSSGETVLETASAKTFTHLLLASSDLEQGKTYILYIDDEKYEEFTISSNVTTVGTATNGMNRMNGNAPSDSFQRR